MGKGRARWRFGLGFGASLGSWELSLGAERVWGGGLDSVLCGSRWARGGRGGDSGWGLGHLWAARNLVSGPRGSGVVALRAYRVGAGGQGEGEVGIRVGVLGHLWAAGNLVSGPRGSGVVALRPHCVGAGGQGLGPRGSEVVALRAHCVGAGGQGLGRSGNSGWGLGLLWAARNLVSGPRGSGVVALRAHCVGVGG